MFHVKTAVIAATLALFVSTNSVQAQDTLEPDGYDVQVFVVTPEGRGFWWTIDRFETEGEALAYREYLNFLIDIATTVNHRGQTDPVTWEKFLDEIDLPRGWWCDLFIRVQPHYDYSRFLGLPMSYSRLF